MSRVLVTESHLTDIADAIRGKLGVQTEYRPGDMAAAVGSIDTPALEALTVTQNGSYVPSTGRNGFSAVTANVPNTYEAADEGKVVSNGALTAQSSDTVTANGIYDTTTLSQVTVHVSTAAPTLPTLPSDYQQVEYLTFSGGEYIYVENVPTYCVIQATGMYGSYSTENCMVGYSTGSSARDYEIRFRSGSINIWQRNAIYTKQFRGSQSVSGGYCIFAQLVDGHDRFYIGRFQINGGNSDDGIIFQGRFIDVIVYAYRDETRTALVPAMRFVPCYRKSDSVPGIYELYSGTFYTNIGTGSFAVGPDMN